jgi:glucose dehydrogenase
MKIKAIFCLSLLMIISSIGAAKTIRPDCGPIKKSVTDWPKFHFDLGSTGYNPYESILSPATVGNLVLEWNYTTAGPVESKPAVVGGVIYVGGIDNNVYALNASNGCLLWKYTTGLYVN